MPGWNQNDLTAAAATPLAEGEPFGYVFDAQGTQHVNYCGQAGHVYELWWDTGGWHAKDLSVAGGAPATASNPRGYMFDAQGTQHVNYLGPDSHVHELWWDNNGWHHNDLTAAAPGAPNAVGNPGGYMFVGQGTQHVNYRGTDNHIHELWWDSNGWHHNDLTAAAAGAPTAVGDPYGYVFNAQGTQHVNYRGTDNHIHELWWDSNGWHHNDLTAAAAGAPNAVGDPYGYVFDRQGTQHVNYRGTDNHIHELWWDSNGWHHNDLTAAAAGAPNAVSDPRGYMFAAQGTQHVNYVGTDGHVHELWWDGTWHHNDLTAATASTVSAIEAPRGYIFGAQATQHVNFWGTDGDIHEFWWSAPCSLYLGLNEQHQEQDEWCWAATTVSISLFYDPGSIWTQCTLVNQAFNLTTCCTDGSSAACNQGWWPNLSLPITGNLSSYTNASAPLATVIAEINSGRPISIAIWWYGGGGHNPAIDGYDNCDTAAPTIDIQDPWYGPSTQDFNSFPSTYNGGASWGNTYFTQPYYAA